MTGTLVCDGDLVVAGTIKGETKVRGALTLLEGGRWEGNLEVINGIIGGEVDGNVIALEKIEIRKSARVHGTVHAGILAVAEGAKIDGEIGTTSDASVVRFQEKRKADK